MRHNVSLWVQVGALVVFGLVSASGFGQVVTGTLVGTIRDSSGAVVPNADVTVTNQNTGVSLNTKSNQVGDYVAPYLGPGSYSVTVKLPGFQTTVSANNDVSVNETRRVDLVLSPGVETQTVEVSGQTLALQTESTSLQANLNERLLEAVPNLNRNPWYYGALLPNVVKPLNLGGNDTQSTMALGVGIDARTGAYSAFSINGGQPFSNDLRLDGVSVLGTGWQAAVVNPNTDGISEVRVITNDYTAEYGRGQGIVLITTKSGTNQFHGSVFDQIRNEALNANTFGNNAQGVARGPYKLNQFGASGGGPIIKDKAFFFVSYEGFRFKRSQDGFLTVPTPAERLGDFSKTLINDNGVPTPLRLFDPFNVTQIGSNLFQRAEVPNADIRNLPRGVDPFALKILSFYPQPNSPPIDVYNTNNYRYRLIVPFHKNNVNSRVDFQKGMHRIYGTYGFQLAEGTFPGFFGPENPFQGPRNSANPKDNTPYATIGDTLAISPTFVADIRFGMMRTRSDNSRPTFSNFDYNAVGMPANIQAVIPIAGSTPDMEFTQRWSSLNADGFFHKSERVTHYEGVASVTKVAGKWTVKTGVDYRVDLSNFQDIAEGSARLDSPGWTGGSGSYSAQFIDAIGNLTPQNSTPAIQGFNDANILMGAGAWTQLNGGFSIRPALKSTNLALYMQNDWRATPQLVVNLGLRWDLQPGMTERFDRLTSFDREGKNPFGGAGAMAFAGAGGYSRNLWDTEYTNFQPRLGLAYRFSEKTVVRGGYGITYLPTNTGLRNGCGGLGCRPFAYTNNLLVYGTQPRGVPIGTFHDSNVSTIVPAPGPDPNNPINYLVASPACTNCNIFNNRHQRNGRVQQWNVAIEKTLGSEWLVSAAYTGTKGSRLQLSRPALAPFGVFPDSILNCYRSGMGCTGANSDIAGKGYLQTGIDRATDQVPNPFNPSGTIPFQGLMGAATIPRGLRDSPFPMFSGAGVDDSYGVSDYHAMTLAVRHQFSNGLDLNAHYTYSKNLSISQTPVQTDFPSIRDFRNFDHNRILDQNDITHRFVYVVSYDLPFGNWTQSSVLKKIVGGWRVGSVGTFQGGTPLFLSGGADGSLNTFPDVVPGQPLEVPKALQRWYDGRTTVTLPSGRQITPNANTFLKYNVDAFRGRVIADPNNPGRFIPDIYWDGSAMMTYGPLRQGGRNNVDVSIRREFRITERFSAEITADCTNFFNHTQFKSYAGSLGGVNTGSGVVGAATNSSSFGTHGFDTYEARQFVLGARIRF